MQPFAMSPTLSQEKMLFDQIIRLSKLRSGRTGVCVHFSKLSNAYQRDKFKEIAIEAFNSYVSGFEGIIFPLKDGDLFFLAKDVTQSALETVVERIKCLFSQDPLIAEQRADGKSKFCTYYNLETEYDELLDWIKNLVNIVELKIKNTEDLNIIEQSPLKPGILARLQESLRSVDVTNVARRQTVCTLIENTDPKPLFEEIFISIKALEEIVAPNVNIVSNKWLFQHLTNTLDFRIMDMLVRDGINFQRPFSLNLNVQTILSPEFSRFEDAITPQLKGRLVIEINKIDVISDMGSYLFAKDYLHDHGFRICLDGITHHTIPFFNKSKLGFDLVKLYWTPNALDIILPSMKPDLRNIIMEIGQAHVILCRCDNETAIETGQELGIVMFQGHEVDKIMEKANISHESKFYS